MFHPFSIPLLLFFRLNRKKTVFRIPLIKPKRPKNDSTENSGLKQLLEREEEKNNNDLTNALEKFCACFHASFPKAYHGWSRICKEIYLILKVSTSFRLFVFTLSWMCFIFFSCILQSGFEMCATYDWMRRATAFASRHVDALTSDAHTHTHDERLGEKWQISSSFLIRW